MTNNITFLKGLPKRFAYLQNLKDALQLLKQSNFTCKIFTDTSLRCTIGIPAYNSGQYIYFYFYYNSDTLIAEVPAEEFKTNAIDTLKDIFTDIDKAINKYYIKKDISV